MNKTLLIAVVSIALASVSSVAHAQGSGSGVNVAVVDISKVFKNHPRFKSVADKIKAEIKGFEESINVQRKQLIEERKKLQQFAAGSAEYKRLEETLARQASELQVQAGLKRKEVLESEAKLYYETYVEIQRAVGLVAQKFNISLVLRYNSKPIDPNDRANVLAGVNRPIVFQRNIDITTPVLEQLGVQAAQNPPPRRR